VEDGNGNVSTSNADTGGNTGGNNTGDNNTGPNNTGDANGDGDGDGAYAPSPLSCYWRRRQMEAAMQLLLEQSLSPQTPAHL
jgi:hypothetical protein